MDGELWHIVKKIHKKQRKGGRANDKKEENNKIIYNFELKAQYV